MYGKPVAAWVEDDPEVGPIDYTLWLDELGQYRLSLNGQGYLPIEVEKAKKLIEETIDKC